MTTASMVAGFLTAFFSGLLAGRCLRSFRAGNAVAFAVAVTAGLLALHASNTSDLLRVIQPKVASDWLPLLSILAACCVLIPATSYRIGCGLILAIAIPVRLLWGSIYLPSESFGVAGWLCIAAWAATLAVSVLLVNDQSVRRMSWKTAVWGLAVAGTTAVITLSGSLTYGATTGVCGLATLSVLIATSQISNIAAVPVICLIGLSAAFSELPVPIAGALMLAWIGVLFVDRMTMPRFTGVLRGAVVSVLIAAVSVTIVRVIESQETADISTSGYGSFSSDLSVETFDKSDAGQSTHEATDESARGKSQTQPESGDMKRDKFDPFEGFEMN